MSRRLAMFSMVFLCLVAFGCSQDGASVDNPVAPASPALSATGQAGFGLDAAGAGRVVICHHDVDDDSPDYESIVIEVNGNSVQRHQANHGDCTTSDPIGTFDCSCEV